MGHGSNLLTTDITTVSYNVYNICDIYNIYGM